MNRLLVASLLSVGLSVSAFAAQTTPKSISGDSLDSKYAGVTTCEITSADGTSAKLCTSGAGIVLDVFASSVATTDTIVFRDSNTANTSSTVLFAIDKNSLDKANRIYPRFKNGLSANALVAPGAAGSQSRPNWTIVYVKDLN